MVSNIEKMLKEYKVENVYDENQIQGAASWYFRKKSKQLLIEKITKYLHTND